MSGGVGRLALRAARVWLGGSRLLSPGMVLVAGGRIVDVDGTGAVPPADATVVDFGDRTILPGLIDAHVHLAFDASPDVLPPLIEGDDASIDATMADAARRHLAAGVTTVRDLGDRRFGSLPLRDYLRTHPLDGPELLVAGPPLTRRKGHCWFLGGEADTTEELVVAVSERAERACDVVKIMATGGVLTPGFLPHESQYGLDALRAVVAAADERGLPTAAHAHGSEGIQASVTAGVSSVEHCMFFTSDGAEIDWEVLAQMANQGIYASFTTATLPGATPPPPVAAALAVMRAAMPRIHELGVPIVISSDAGIVPEKHHGVLPYGVVELSGLGLTNGQALESATSVAAAACGVADRKGRIAPGCDADLLVVPGEPARQDGRPAGRRRRLPVGHCGRIRCMNEAVDLVHQAGDRRRGVEIRTRRARRALELGSVNASDNKASAREPGRHAGHRRRRAVTGVGQL